MEDFIYFFKYWFTLFLLGIIFYPFTSLIFKKFKDKGWIFSKIIGIAISSWTLWILSYGKILKYTQFSTHLVLLLFTIINIVIIHFRRKSLSSIFNKDVLKNIIISEIVFTIVFILWGNIKGISPAITNTTEQFMDYGFMNCIMNSEYMPPSDMWFSGESINYYYYGIYVSSFISKISGLKVNEGYNLMIAFIATCSFALPYCIGYNLFKNMKNKFNKFEPYVLAICIGIAVSLGGTMHYPIYRWFSNDKDNYYYVDETRYIGFKPDTSDKAVTELPAYSFIVSDLHPHYIDLIFSITAIAFLLEFILTDKEEFKAKKIHLNLALVAFILGIQKMTNFWDLPIYLVIISLCVIVKHLICNKINFKNLLCMFGDLILIVLIQTVVALPFTLDLHMGFSKIYLTEVSSPLYKLMVLWGLPTICLLIISILFSLKCYENKNKLQEYLQRHLLDVFIILIGFCALGLVIIPELVYVKDIYGQEYNRFNTMFKLTYQSYILFAICTSYIIFRLIFSKNKFLIAVSIILLCANFTTFGYGVDALIVNFKEKHYVGISETEIYLKNTLPHDYLAIQWMKQNIEKDKVFTEATSLGNSYSTQSRVSVFTGNPTVLGWSYHEWLWRCKEDMLLPEEVTTRNDELSNFYQKYNDIDAKEFIKKYNVSYIYIGELEYEKYSDIQLDVLLGLGEVVYSDNTGENTVYIIKV